MRLINPLILSLPLLASAQSFPQLQSALSKIKSFIPSAATATTPEAADEAARKNVVPLTLGNWRETFTAPSAQEAGREWYVLVTGGNNTCSGSCGVVEKAWKVSCLELPQAHGDGTVKRVSKKGAMKAPQDRNASTLVVSTGPSPPRLAILDCETQPVLCSTWIASAPSVWHILPSKDHTTIRVIELNRTTTNTETFLKLHKEKEWKGVTPYKGIFHPFDGLISKLYLGIPMGYAIWGLSLIPSWALMLAVSLGSRTLLGRRVGRQPAGGPTPSNAAN